jgi:hypothetical protein
MVNHHHLVDALFSHFCAAMCPSRIQKLFGNLEHVYATHKIYAITYVNAKTSVDVLEFALAFLICGINAQRYRGHVLRRWSRK